MVEPERTPENGMKNNNENDQKGFIGRLAGIGQTWLAILFIVPAFIIIGYMLYIQLAI
jgi:hypothetical protein